MWLSEPIETFPLTPGACHRPPSSIMLHPKDKYLELAPLPNILDPFLLCATNKILESSYLTV